MKNLFLTFILMSCVGKQDLVQIQENENIVFDLRYATTNNFTNTQIYLEEKVFIHKNALKDFKCVVKKAQQQGYKVKIFDAWRPYEAQEMLFSIVNDPDFVSPPTGNCYHCRGTAIDLTLIDKNNKELDMGTEFDDFTTKSYANANEITKEQKQNRKILQEIMQSCNYEIYNYEWWHFNHKNTYKITTKYKAGNLMKVKIASKRIALTGTHGVGKTTILNKVKARNNKIEIIEEQFRVLHKKHQFKKQTNLITNLIMQCQLQLENSLENKNTLADRTIFDTFIYYDYFSKSKSKINKDLIKRYDKIYLIIPSNRAIENDNFRLINKAEQVEISKKFEEFFKDFDNVMIVNQEQQDEVVELILKEYE